MPIIYDVFFSFTSIRFIISPLLIIFSISSLTRKECSLKEVSCSQLQSQFFTSKSKANLNLLELDMIQLSARVQKAVVLPMKEVQTRDVRRKKYTESFSRIVLSLMTFSA